MTNSISTSSRMPDGWTIGDPPSDSARVSGHPGCERGRLEDNWEHDYADAEDRSRGQTFIYCRQCGDVRKLEEARP